MLGGKITVEQEILMWGYRATVPTKHRSHSSHMRVVKWNQIVHVVAKN